MYALVPLGIFCKNEIHKLESFSHILHGVSVLYSIDVSQLDI